MCQFQYKKCRSKVELILYDSKIRINGQKLNKKRVLLDFGNEIDTIRGFSQKNPSRT